MELFEHEICSLHKACACGSVDTCQWVGISVMENRVEHLICNVCCFRRQLMRPPITARGKRLKIRKANDADTLWRHRCLWCVVYETIHMYFFIFYCFLCSLLCIRWHGRIKMKEKKIILYISVSIMPRCDKWHDAEYNCDGGISWHSVSVEDTACASFNPGNYSTCTRAHVTTISSVPYPLLGTWRASSLDTIPWTLNEIYVHMISWFFVLFL